jgi:uncharacterized protein
VVRRSGGTLEVGRTLPGRGAWVCPSKTCIDLAERRKAFGRAFKAELADGAIEALRARMVERTTSS